MTWIDFLSPTFGMKHFLKTTRQYNERLRHYVIRSENDWRWSGGECGLRHSGYFRGGGGWGQGGTGSGDGGGGGGGSAPPPRSRAYNINRHRFGQ